MNSATETPQEEISETENKIESKTPQEVMTADEVAALLRVNRKTVYTAFKLGEIPGGRRIGGTIRFHRAAVLQWLAQGQACAPRSLRGVR